MNKIQMKFEYTNEYGYKTVLEKESDGYTFQGELNTLLYEFANFMVACGFSEKSIEEKILYEL